MTLDRIVEYPASLSGRFRTTASRVAVGIALCFCAACDDNNTSDTAADTGNVNAGTTETTETAETGTTDTGGTAGTAAPLECSDATDAASCATAVGDESGEGCTWLAFMDLSIDAGGACSFADAGTGLCRETYGVDDGCDYVDACDDARSVYFRGSDGSWQMAEGTACRASQGAEALTQCDNSNEDEAPCSCACELPIP